MYYYLKNLQGDIVSIVDSTGAKVAQYTYDAWGNILTVTDGNGVAVASSNKTHIANLNPFRYRGYYYDTESNIYYLQSRYYDPTLGRFISSDVPEILGLAAMSGNILSTNLFTYCINNPVIYSDPLGHWVISAGLEGGAAFFLGLSIAVGVNYDGTWLSVTFSLGFLLISNVSAYIVGYFAYYPGKKSVNDISGWGISVGVAFSMGVHLGAGGGAEISSSGNGFSASIGVGASVAPIPYFQIKFGYTWALVKWNLSSTKNGTSSTKYVLWTKAIKVTKQSTYTDIYIFKINKTIRVFTSTKKVSVF